MFNKSKTATSNNTYPTQADTDKSAATPEINQDIQPAAQPQRNNMMDMISSNASKPSILSEGFSFRGEIAAKGAIHVEGSLNGQVQVDELTIGSRGQVEGVVTCSSLHIKGKFSGTATCSELIVTSSASVDGHVVYQTLSVQKGASIKGELLLVK